MDTLAGQTLPASGVIPFVVCDGDGRILRSGFVPDDATGDLQAQAGEYVFAGIADAQTDYIDDVLGTAVVATRPASGVIIDFAFGYGPTPGSLPTVFLYDVPNGATVEFISPDSTVFTTTADGTDGDGDPAAETTINVRLELVGRHRVCVSAWPALDFVDEFFAEF